MNDLSNAVGRDQNKQRCKPIPSVAIFILVPLFVIGLSVSVFMLIVVHNAAFFLSFLLLSALVLSFTAWNTLNWRQKAAVFCFLHSFPDSGLAAARDGQLVKLTGRFSTDFYITDRKFGIRAMVKAGSVCKVVLLIVESNLVSTTRQCRILSPHLRKWLQERNLSTEARLLQLEEGYIQEGSFVIVIGVLHRNNDILMIVQPQEVLSTGYLWQKNFLPVDVDGLVLGIPDVAGPILNPDYGQEQEQ